MKTKILAIIPARGGSKGIPGKNIKSLGGKPLIQYSIDAALKSETVTRVIVSTDDENIARVSKDSGAEVCMRPINISGDKAASEDAIIHVLNVLKQNENYEPELIVFLQCTSPLTLAEDIDGIVSALQNESADSAFSAVRFYHFVWRKGKNDDAEGINHEKGVRQMRQDREQQFLENGAIYVFKTCDFLKTRHRFFGKTTIYEMPAERCLEIDEPHDFELAIEAMKRMDSLKGVERLPENIGALVMDFDGVFTDNAVFVMEDGREAVRCHRGDGMGLSWLKEKRVPLFILSKEINSVVVARAKKLGIEVQNNISDKLPALMDWIKNNKIELKDVIYIGNDINDIECMDVAGCSVAVADAVPEVLKKAKIVLKHNGGNGALRELAELILAKFNNNNNVI